MILWSRAACTCGQQMAIGSRQTLCRGPLWSTLVRGPGVWRMCTCESTCAGMRVCVSVGVRHCAGVRQCGSGVRGLPMFRPAVDCLLRSPGPAEVDRVLDRARTVSCQCAGSCAVFMVCLWCQLGGGGNRRLPVPVERRLVPVYTSPCGQPPVPQPGIFAVLL